MTIGSTDELDMQCWYYTVLVQYSVGGKEEMRKSHYTHKKNNQKIKKYHARHKEPEPFFE